jgi:hypothetical protein
MPKGGSTGAMPFAFGIRSSGSEASTTLPPLARLGGDSGGVACFLSPLTAHPQNNGPKHQMRPKSPM